MESRNLELVNTQMTRSFLAALNDWRKDLQTITFPEYLTCLFLFAESAVQEILRNVTIIDKETKDFVLEDMHSYLNMAGDSALKYLLYNIRESEKNADAEEVAEAEESQEDNGYFEKFEDD